MSPEPSVAFRRDGARSHGDPRSPNLLFHADNLAALSFLSPSFASRFRCVYLDPPFNTGRTFREYDDRRAPDAWRALMRPRVDAIVPLLADDGALFAEIDDTQLADLTALLDAALGRENRISIVTVVRSAPTGHKAINRGPVNVTDFLLVYAKDRAKVRLRPQWKVRRTYDRAYSSYVVNRDAPASEWRFVPLSKATGKKELEAFAIAHAESVVRFAQPRYEAVSKEARAMIDRSKHAPDRVFVLEREGYKPMILRGGNRVLFLADKVREVNGERVLVEPLTNVWDDLGFQGIAREGGVVFTRNKKPERLLARVLAMATDPGDWVLDPFLGSGTTAAVALKMRRAWVGIESGEHVDTLCVPRLRRVVDGEDPTGITREMGWRGGDGFSVLA